MQATTTPGAAAPQGDPMAQQKYLVIIRGKGTPHEQRITTTIPLYWSEALQRYVTIPTR